MSWSVLTRVGNFIGHLNKYVKRKFLFSLSYISNSVQVKYNVFDDLTLCLPFISENELKEIISILESLKTQDSPLDRAKIILLTIGNEVLRKTDTSNVICRQISMINLKSFKEIIGYLAGAHFQVAFISESTDSDMIKKWCDAYHVQISRNLNELIAQLNEKKQQQLFGPLQPTYGVKQGLWPYISSNQYAFTESLDWNIISKLPHKFKELGQSATIQAHPLSRITGSLNRLARQRTMGEIYQGFFKGNAVLDLGCDIRGVEDFVSKPTRYLGVDMHGFPDHTLDLQKDALPFQAKSIDTVVCIETLEHLDQIHQTFDQILSISSRYVIASLPNESAFTENRLVDSLGGIFSFSTPIAPLFDRHKWVGSISDNLDFLYYRGARSGFKIIQIDLFFMPSKWCINSQTRVFNDFKNGHLRKLNRQVGLICCVLERVSV